VRVEEGVEWGLGVRWGEDVPWKGVVGAVEGGRRA
jgi:hypothetical protein